MDFVEPPATSNIIEIEHPPSPQIPSLSELSDWIGKGKVYKDVPEVISAELLRRLSIPPNAKDIIPVPSVSVSSLLLHAMPPKLKTLSLISPQSCFTDHIPNIDPASSDSKFHLQPIPSLDLIQNLGAKAGQAMLDGKVSVRDWTRKDEELYLPFYTISLWYDLHQSKTVQQEWARAVDWTRNAKIPSSLRDRVESVLNQIPWMGNLVFSGNHISISDTAHMLSQQMLTTGHVDSMLRCLEVRIAEEQPTNQEFIIIAPTEFGESLRGLHQYEDAYRSGKTSTSSLRSVFLRMKSTLSCLEPGNSLKLWSVAYSPPLHFGTLAIEVKEGDKTLYVNWADSIGRSQPKDMVTGIRIWASHHFSEYAIRFEKSLKCAVQDDSYSCSIIAINTVKHHTLGDSLWSKKSRESARVLEFLVVMEHHLKNEASLRGSEPLVTATDTNLHLLVNTPTPEAAPKPLKRKLAHTDNKKRNIQDSESDFIEPKSIPKRQKTGNDKNRAGHSMRNKAALNQSVLEGKFIINSTKWDTYVDKLKELDPRVEVTRKSSLARHVRHFDCGEQIVMSAPYDISRFKEHLKSCARRKKTSALARTNTLVAIFGTSERTKDAAEKPKPTIKTLPCPGLSKNNDERIGTYLERTAVATAGGNSEHVVAQSIYKREFSALSPAQREIVFLRQTQSHRWRLDHQHKRVYAIGNASCLENVDLIGDTASQLQPCAACLGLLSIPEFRSAIRRPIPSDTNRQFIPHRHQNAALGEMYAKNRGLKNLITEDSEENIFLRFARQFAQGKFDNNPVFLGMFQVLVVQAERNAKGKGLQNMTYPVDFDQFCHDLICIRPEAYRTFQQALGGRSERNFRVRWSKAPSFTQGISEHSLIRAQTYLKDYGYPTDGPLATGVDDTKLLAASRPYYDGRQKKWFLVGGVGDPMEVADIDQLQVQLDRAKDSQATKLRLWTMSIPLPNIPPLILAALPISSKNSAEDLATMEKDLLERLINDTVSFNIISLGSDGTSVERQARRELVKNGFAKVVTYRIPHPEGSDHRPIVVEILQIRTRFMVITQDSKHLRKTCRNNLFTGAKSLVLGRHLICFQQVWDIAFAEDSPLYVRDVKKLDRQDDLAAARLFSASTLEFLVKNQADNSALIIYLFVFGEMVDAYQSRTISHVARVKMVLRAKFFKDIWKIFLKEAGYLLSRHFISHEADDITDILINGYMGLLYIHRDILEKRFPFLAWRHGTETNEHVFGFLRDMVPDFTMLDVLRLVPKLTVRLMAACKRASKEVDLRRTASGYSHTYSDAENVSLNLLASFPDDKEIAAAAKEAYDEALTLWELMGYYPTTFIPPGAGDNQKDVDEENMDGDEANIYADADAADNDEQEHILSDRQELQMAFEAASDYQAKGLPPQAIDAALDECAFAAASLNSNNLERLEKLPSEDPETMEEIRRTLAEYLAMISAQGPEAEAAVQELIRNATMSNDPPALDDIGMTDAGLSTDIETSKGQSTPVNMHDWSQWVTTRFKNQSRESAKSIRIKSDIREPEGAKSKKPSEHKLLANKIHEIIRQGSEQGSSTGLNRRVRHTEPPTGNTANAQAVAKTSAARVIARRRKLMLTLELGGELSTAKVDLVSPLTCTRYCIVLSENEIMIGKVISLYERGGGKAAKHCLVFEASSIGSLSYISMQVWQYHRQKRFRALCGLTAKLNLPRYTHLPAAACLYLIPNTCVKVLSNGEYVELSDGFFDKVYTVVVKQKAALVNIVKKLVEPGKKDTIDNGDGQRLE